jgi:hypothetical protein
LRRHIKDSTNNTEMDGWNGMAILGRIMENKSFVRMHWCTPRRDEPADSHGA